MKRINLLSICLICIIATSDGQASLTQGAEMPFTFKKQPPVTTLISDGTAYFIFKSLDYTAPYPTMIAVNGNGNVTRVGEIKYQQGTMGNMTDLLSVLSVDNKLLAIIENRNKSTNQNKLTARAVDSKGVLSTDEKEIGSFTFDKMGKSGDWYTAVTPDGKHLAVVGQVPGEKEELVQFKYYLLDAELKQISTGQFTFPETNKRVFMNAFYASDKGDFYLVKDESEKGYRYPLLYKSKTGDKVGTVIPVTPEDPKQKLMNYTASVHPNGDLIIAGYLKEKSGFTIGDIQATGTWIYNAAKAKMSISLFNKPVSNATAEGIIFNGTTTYLIGEQLKADRETPTQQGLAFEENYNYKHNDIIVTAFDNESVKKFELVLSKKFTARNFDQDLYPAYGIINNKLAVVYNDVYGKYIPNTSYENYKVPVLVYITNDGLMEAPIHFEKEFQTTRTSYTLYPAFSATTTTSGMILLAGNGSGIKGVVIK